MMRILYLFAFAVASAGSTEQTIRHPDVGDPEGRNEYQVEVLRAVLTSTIEDYGPFRMLAVAEMPQAREIRSLIDGEQHDVLWTVTSAEREAQMRPIRFPLLRGLLGHRICLVRRDDPLFQQSSPPPKETLVIGQAITWPDTAIFEANGFTVEAGSDYLSTLRMLSAGRTNCFPRGLSEIDIELAAYGSDDLIVEQRLSFLYLAPMYFFVARGREDLARRIAQGLTRIETSGVLAEIHGRHFDSESLLERYHMADRHVFCLDNPDIEPPIQRAMRRHLISGPDTFAERCPGEAR